MLKCLVFLLCFANTQHTLTEKLKKLFLFKSWQSHTSFIKKVILINVVRLTKNCILSLVSSVKHV